MKAITSLLLRVQLAHKLLLVIGLHLLLLMSRLDHVHNFFWLLLLLELRMLLLILVHGLEAQAFDFLLALLLLIASLIDSLHVVM